MARTNEAGPEAPWVRARRWVAVGVCLAVAGVVLALEVSKTFWSLAALGVLATAGGALVALARAMRPALRPQLVKYDHSWPTHLLGETSTPHRGPATEERTPPDRDGPD
jgi:hypothetical protein